MEEIVAMEKQLKNKADDETILSSAAPPTPACDCEF